MLSYFTNPILWEDLPDLETFRVNETYYMSASSFHFSPGAPILKSGDLVHWEYIGHSVPFLPPSERFTLDGVRPTAYGKGVWASTMKYREKNGLFYFYTAIQGTDKTFIYTAKDPAGEWTAHPPIERFYYDLGVLVDEDDGMYIAYGTRTIEVARLDGDGLREIENRVVYRSDAYLEGARMYRINGSYYIWVTKDWDTQCVLKSTTGPFGPYEEREIIIGMRSPIVGSGSPHQGGLVDTPDGQWYYMAFSDAYPVGRIPVLAPLEFDRDGWPKVAADYSDANGQWLLQYPYPHVDCLEPKSCFRRYNFTGSTLEHCWEWNHNPDNSKWSIQDSHLVLHTGTVTESLHLATNTLTLRTVGPGSMATFYIDSSGMKDGDRAGVSLFRDESSYIGIHKEGDKSILVYLDGAKVGPINLPVGWLNGRPAALDWELVSNGSVKEAVSLKSHKMWLRVKVDLGAATPHVKGYGEAARYAKFEYSYDGTEFECLGPTYELTKSIAGYVGYRFAVFNFATKALGGEIRLRHCDLEAWSASD
ncbi:glycosyl hydrolase [Aspergillus venezuelensis]